MVTASNITLCFAQLSGLMLLKTLEERQNESNKTKIFTVFRFFHNALNRKDLPSYTIRLAEICQVH